MGATVPEGTRGGPGAWAHGRRVDVTGSPGVAGPEEDSGEVARGLGAFGRGWGRRRRNG